MSEETLLKSSRDNSSIIKLQIENKLGEVIELAESAEIQSMTLNLQKEHLLKNMKRLDLEDVAIVNLNGIGTYIKGKNSLDFINIGLKSNKPFFPDIFISKITGKPVFLLAAPIKQNNEIAAYLVARDSAEFLCEITNPLGLEKTGYSYIMDSTRKFITYSNRSFVNKSYNLIESSKTDSSLSNLGNALQKIHDTHTGVIQYKKTSGIPVYRGYNKIPNTSWILVVTTPKNEILHKFYVLFCIIAGQIIFFVVIGLFFAIIIVKKIANPIATMS